MADAPRAVMVEGTYHVTGVGTMTATTEPDPIYQRGELVTVDGELFRIERMERFMVGPGTQPGLKMGLLLVPATSGVDLRPLHRTDHCEPDGTRTECVCRCDDCLGKH